MIHNKSTPKAYRLSYADYFYVICLCNLKPAKMRNVMSHAMVLCGSNADHTKVELIVPPSGSVPGDRVTFPGLEGEPDERLPAKRDVFALVKPVRAFPFIPIPSSMSFT